MKRKCRTAATIAPTSHGQVEGEWRLKDTDSCELTRTQRHKLHQSTIKRKLCLVACMVRCSLPNSIR